MFVRYICVLLDGCSTILAPRDPQKSECWTASHSLLLLLMFKVQVCGGATRDSPVNLVALSMIATLLELG